MKRIAVKIACLSALLFSLTFAPLSNTKAQIICDISIDTPMPVCPDIYFELGLIVFIEPNLTFDWQEKSEGGTFVSVGTDSVYFTKITDSTTFKVIVIDTITHDTCESEPFGVSVHQQINIEFDQLQLTCTNGDTTNGNSAKVRAIATGEFQPDEYHYFWDVLPLQIAPGDSSLAVDLKAHQYYMITVKDNYGCPKTDTVWTEAFVNPEVEIYADPDTAYLQNPFITYSFINLTVDSIPISRYSWWFSDTIDDPYNTSNLLTPIYEYGAVGEFYVILTVYNAEGCDTTFLKTVDVKPVKLFIPNVFTPGTGGPNEKFVITDVDKTVFEDALNKFYVSSHLVVFNRMGRTVFEAKNYDNSWDGSNLPDGVYYFVLKCNGVKSTDVFKGSVTIIRGN